MFCAQKWPTQRKRKVTHKWPTIVTHARRAKCVRKSDPRLWVTLFCTVLKKFSFTPAGSDDDDKDDQSTTKHDQSTAKRDQSMAKRDKTRPNMAKHDKTRQNTAKHDTTQQNTTKNVSKLKNTLRPGGPAQHRCTSNCASSRLFFWPPCCLNNFFVISQPRGHLAA